MTAAFPEPRWDFDDKTPQASRPAPPAEAPVAAAPHGGPRRADPSASGLLDQINNDAPARRARPQEGLRSALYEVSGGRVNLGLSPEEQKRVDLQQQIAADPGSGLFIVMVWAQKGGVGKTTTAAMLGNALAGNATYPVLVIDVNPDGGSLGVRVPITSKKTTLDLRDALRQNEQLPPSDLGDYVNRSPFRLDAIVMPPGQKPTDPLSGRDFQAIVTYLRRYGHYKIVVVDCGTDPSGPVMDGVLAEADQLVVVATTIKDEATVTAGGLEVLARENMGDLIANSVVTIVEKSPKDPDATVQAEIKRTADQVRTYFAQHAKAVVPVPYDSRLRIGNLIDPAALTPATRMAHLELAAAVVNRLREESAT